ncbi:MAG: SCO family protein [Acidimicrobiales bacterium]|jgi:cytochrome oxidase Cu insertion factor (SCO1/SenC/PrrC family)
MSNEAEDSHTVPSPAPDASSTPTSSPGLDEADRAAALRAGRTPVSPKFILGAIAAFAVLGLGGALLQHFDGNLGLPTSTTLAPSSTTTLAPEPLQESPLDEFMGLKDIGFQNAPGIALTSQNGHPWNLRDDRGKVVVLAFYNAICNDICPVLGSEIAQARALLGTHATKVDFVIVNTDPHDLRVSRTPRALSVPGLAGAKDVRFVTGPLAKINPVWIHYGISIETGKKTPVVTHNNIVYFIDPRGRLRVQVDPFASENRSGAVGLSASDIHRFALGISRVAGSLVK